MAASQTILIVDDNERMVASLARLLKLHKFKVLTAKDGAEGVLMAEKYQPDLVLLDIDLPALDGFQVLEQIQKRKVRTRVVMFSGHYKTIKDAVRGMKGGACDYLVKPHDVDSLVDRLKGYLITEDTINERVVEELGRVTGVEVSETKGTWRSVIEAAITYGCIMGIVYFSKIPPSVGLLTSFVLGILAHSLLTRMPWENLKIFRTEFQGAKLDVEVDQLERGQKNEDGKQVDGP